MSKKNSATSNRVQEPWTRMAVWLHTLIGQIFLWHYPLISLLGFGTHAGGMSNPLLTGLGLFWSLVTAGLVMRWRWTIKVGMAVHFLTLLVPSAGIVVGTILLMGPPSRGHMAMSAGPAALFMILLSTAVALFSLACIYSLWRLLRYPWTNQLTWSGPGIAMAAASVLMFVLSVGFDWSRQRYEASRREDIERTVAHEDRVVAIAFSPDGTRIATGAGGLYADSWIRIWNTGNGQVIRQLQVRRPVVAITWSRDGEWLIAGCGEELDADRKSAIMVWDTQTWDLIHRYDSNHLSALTLSPDRQLIAIAASESTQGESGTEIRLFQPGKPEAIAFGEVPPSKEIACSQVTSMTFTPDGQQLMAVGGIGLAVWTLPLQSVGSPATVVELPERVTSVDWSPDGKELVFAASGKEFLYQVSLSDMQRQQGSLSFRLGHLPPNHPIIAMSRIDEMLIAEQQAPVVQCLSWSTGSLLYFIAPVDSPSAIAVSNDGAVAAIGTGRRIRLHDGRSGEFLRELIKP